MNKKSKKTKVHLCSFTSVKYFHAFTVVNDLQVINQSKTTTTITSLFSLAFMSFLIRRIPSNRVAHTSEKVVKEFNRKLGSGLCVTVV